MNQVTFSCQHLSPLQNMICNQQEKRNAGGCRGSGEKNVYPLTESHNVRAGDGGRRKWRVSIWKSEGVQVLGRNTMRCHFFTLFVWWCIERICLPAMSGSDPCGFLLSGSLFIFYTLFKTLLLSTTLKLWGSYLYLWDLRNQTEICVFVRHCCWIKQGHVISPLFAW